MQFRSKLQYALRLLACLLLLELLTHSIYANAFARFHLWTRLPAEQSAETFDAVTMAALAFYKLIFLWLKFVVIWRLARLFALFDGIDPPENMLRYACVVLSGLLLPCCVGIPITKGPLSSWCRTTRSGSERRLVDCRAGLMRAITSRCQCHRQRL